MFRSVRPSVLLALLVAIACTDQPTEPTTGYEGAALGLTLPPVPEPPTALFATIPGANGAPAHITLGVWESPVVARVTVEGLLDYSGNPGGFLPGTGQIDAAGRYVGFLNSCSLQLSVRVVGYGFIGGYKGGCPNAPQQVGSFTNYTVVSGEIYADRVTGPPGSCYFSGTPCTTITGEETVEVEPLEGAELAITQDKLKVAPGALIRVDVAPTPTYLQGVKVPWTFREFRWEGQGPTVGGGQTKVCVAQPAVGECLVGVYQSGYVVAEAIVNGRLKTEKVWVAVIGGDTLPPPPPPDSIPADTIPTDTIPGGGGAGGGGGSGPPGPPATVSIRLAEGSVSMILPESLLAEWKPPALPDTAMVIIRVDSAGGPLRGRSVSIKLSAVDSSGGGSDAVFGHFHGGGLTAKPAGAVSSPGGMMTDSAGEVRIWYRSSWVSGPVHLKASISDSQSADLLLLVGVPGLVRLVERASDSLVGEIDPHWDSHFVIARMGTMLDSLADSMFTVFHTKVEYNDASLPFGGKFDLALDWGGDHVEHRVGRDIDFRTSIWTAKEQKTAETIWLGLGGTVRDETKTSRPHYHLRYRGNP